jgi:acyl dehydratase
MPEYASAPLIRTHLVRYAVASGDFNLLHHDQTFVKAIGLKNVIAHVMLIMGIVGEAITSWIGNKKISCPLLEHD